VQTEKASSYVWECKTATYASWRPGLPPSTLCLIASCTPLDHIGKGTSAGADPTAPITADLVDPRQSPRFVRPWCPTCLDQPPMQPLITWAMFRRAMPTAVSEFNLGAA